jgi:hypothetical protein
MIECNECGHSDLPGSLFCTECGAFLSDESQPDGTLHPFADMRDKGSEPALLGQEVEPVQVAKAIVFVIPGSGRRVRLPLDQSIHIGRADPNQAYEPALDLTEDEGAEHGVSRQHATIVNSHEGVFIVDLDSTNGTQLNEFRLPPQLPYLLHSGDELRFGQLLVHVFLE